ncbi:hypothetical protein MNBD_NITROSPINAE01-904 [hydrothermal vent metagenome]|uniref:Alpha-D-phosphohexomutase alpha/beta/alpha domain-containing protein n=1 Tax=hydrothermal vent metagenome TaxID=652676 RepID=A0A3B1C0P0_9ZZZZ
MKSRITRLQGTDGVRRHVKLSTAPELAGLSPQDAFLEKDIMTEQFMELYTYCRARQVIESGAVKEKETFIIGWDPRDPSGVFTSAAVDGLLKGGLNVAITGVSPTPAVAIYMRSINAGGSVVITASHNPAVYNGIKIFTRRGLKLLPGDDIELSKLILATDYEHVRLLEKTGTSHNAHDEMKKAFVNFSIDPRNSWIAKSDSLSRIILVADLSNGAFADIAPIVLQKAGFRQVLVLNNKLDGSVNENCGVSELEGIEEISFAMTEENGPLAKNELVKTVFKLGRKEKDSILMGAIMVSGAVFDGDGDRFYRVDYNPITDTCFVLSGDETAVLQAAYRRKTDTTKLFVNTVESDLSASKEAQSMGYKTELTAVGDKWILLEAALAAIRPVAPEEAVEKIEKVALSETPSADFIENILDEEGLDFSSPEDCRFAIGAEESGHNITPGIVNTIAGKKTIMAGNGMKSLLNTYVATSQGAIAEMPVFALRQNHIREPFAKGFKKTLYVYYVDKPKWRRGEMVWENMKNVITDSVQEHWPQITVDEMIRPEDRDMLYLKLIEAGSHVASIFVRNSGTEDKTGITLRGPAEQSNTLVAIGTSAMRLLLVEMKDASKHMAQAEAELIITAAQNGAPKTPVAGLSERDYERLLTETSLKQGLLKSATPGTRLTPLGTWYHSIIEREK